MFDPDLKEFSTWLGQFAGPRKVSGLREIKFSTMQQLCEKFGHPERACPCFHVAGSKGKGTISANIAAILREAGYKTGVYASPHVLHFVERFGTGEQPFEKAVYDVAFQELKTGIEKLLRTGQVNEAGLTWATLTTAFAMLCFRAARVDVAVYEVGLGGRTSSTNVVQPVCCAFGPIELEHTSILGNSLAEIATVKAGILKPNIPAISVAQKPEVEQVLRTMANEVGTTIDFLEEVANYEEEDAEVAMRAVEAAGFKIDRATMKVALEKVTLPGRFEIVKLPNYPEIPYILLDGAHTPNSITSVVSRMQREGRGGVLLFGCAKDKNVEEMAKTIGESGIFTKVILTRPGDFHACDFERMHRAFAPYFGEDELILEENFGRAISLSLDLVRELGRPLIVLGSFYLIGEVKKVLLLDKI